MTAHLTVDRSRPFTVADLDEMPDDGRRYELIDGMLFVSPAPNWAHQEMALTLYMHLRSVCPPEFHTLAAPFAVQTSLTSEVQPDVIVARYADLTMKNLPVAPLLAVEALSSSTRLYDRNLKRAHYEGIGVVDYWILDPAEPGSLTAFKRGPDGCFVDAGTFSGDEEFVTETPFPVTVIPARLLDGLRRR